MKKEWLKEPNRKEFTYKGYHCFIQRNMELGHLCGYVDLPKSSKWYGVGYYYMPDIDVHGGLTFSGWSNDDKSMWRIGFDCAHYNDLRPYYPLSEKVKEYYDVAGIVVGYRNMNYVEDNIKRMVDQIIELEKEY